MKKEQVDLENAVVWIPDSKTPNGIAEVPLADLALEAFREQIRISGTGTWLFPSDENTNGHQKTLKNRLARDVTQGQGGVLPDLRSPFHLRDPPQCGRRSGQVGHAVAAAGGCEGVQEVFADETADEEGGASEVEPERERGASGFCHGEGELMGFCHGFATVGSILSRFLAGRTVSQFLEVV